MLQQIPTHLITGPLGAGKTSLIRSLLQQKPADERWAVLINEFGQIGLDVALLTTDTAGISLAEIAGGCLCCVNGAPFQVGLTRLLRQARPHRLLLEPSGLGHPADLLKQLAMPPWQTVLSLQPPVAVLDAPALLNGSPLPESQTQALPHCGLLIMNKSEHLDAGQRQQLAASLPARPIRWTVQGHLDLAALPGVDQQAGTSGIPLPLPTGPAAPGSLWLDPSRPLCQAQGNADGWSIGWRWHPSQRFSQQRVEAWLATLPWRRAKLILQDDDGGYSANALDGQPLRFERSAWRKDSRVELIFSQPQDEAALSAALAACRR